MHCKDASLLCLANIFNQNNVTFSKWTPPMGNNHDYELLMHSLSPWVMSEFPLKVTAEKRSFDIIDKINCSDNRYSGILTGERLEGHGQRPIVDFIPFGYDVDKLEIRFYESFDIVDAFVIYEAPRTQSGMMKPLYLSQLIHSQRFAKWASKIILFAATDDEISLFTRQTLDGIRKNEKTVTGGKWALERSMRSELMRRFADLDVDKSSLKKFIMKNIEMALGIQNDADEIPSGEALAHLKYCELRKDVEAIYLPAMAFKKNFHWLQTTTDMSCLTGGNINSDTEQLRQHLWRPGPYLWPLQQMLRDKHTRRSHDYSNNNRNSNSNKRFCTAHMGLGAAVHISSVADPAEYLLKRCGVIEQQPQGALSIALVAAGRGGNVTAEMLARELMLPWCAGRNPSVHSSELHSLAARRLLEQAIPWVVRDNERSFPFLLPAPELLLGNLPKHSVLLKSNDNDNNNMNSKHDWVHKTGLPQWRLECLDNAGSRATTY